MPAPSIAIDVKPFPPCGFDRADGIAREGEGTAVGTPTPPGARIATATTFINEFPDSPSIERGEQTTCVHRYKCDIDTAETIVQTTSRGDLQLDSQGYVWKVLTCKMERMKGDFCVVTVTSEYSDFFGDIGTGLDTPPDEFTIDVIEFNPALQKHPRYAPIGLKNKYKITRMQNTGDILSLNSFTNLIDSVGGETTEGLAMEELICKLRKGIDSFYLAGFRVNYSVYSNSPQILCPGGFVENPISTAQIPYYFTSSDQTPTGKSIFDFTDDDGNPLYPALYGAVDADGNPNSLTWFRTADSQVYQRTWFKLTKSWIAAPGGGTLDLGGEDFDWNSTWDEDIYTKAFGGYNTEDIQ